MKWMAGDSHRSDQDNNRLSEMEKLNSTFLKLQKNLKDIKREQKKISQEDVIRILREQGGFDDPEDKTQDGRKIVFTEERALDPLNFCYKKEVKR